MRLDEATHAGAAHTVDRCGRVPDGPPHRQFLQRVSAWNDRADPERPDRRVLEANDIHRRCAPEGAAAPAEGACRIDQLTGRCPPRRRAPQGEVWVKAAGWDGIAPSVSDAAVHHLMIDKVDNTNRALIGLIPPMDAVGPSDRTRSPPRQDDPEVGPINHPRPIEVGRGIGELPLHQQDAEVRVVDDLVAIEVTLAG